MTLAAMLLPVFAQGQTVNSQQSQQETVGKEVRLHRVVYYKIRESDNVEYAATTALREVAQFMAKYPDATITLTGYADRGTGNPTLNVHYALNRATKFKNDLVERYGIDPMRIVADSKGDVEQPFGENDKNRCVIVDVVGHETATPAPALSASDQAEQQRRQYQEDRDLRYAAAMGRTDTIYVVHKDTVWIVPPVDSLREETPFGLDKSHRWRNWFVQVGVGPAIFQGDHNVDAEWKDRLYPAFNFRIGKWVYPALGFRAGVDLDKVHSYYNANAKHPNPLAFKDGKEYYGEFVHGASSDKPYDKASWLYRMDYNAWNFHADVLVNFSSIMWAPYYRRFWNLIGYAGVGCISTWDNGAHDWFNYTTSLNVGILNSFRITEHFDLNIDLHLKKFDDDFNCFRQGRGMDGITNLTIGGTWYFTKRGFRASTDNR